MDARYYDPMIGRFYSNDPVGFNNVHNFNRYAYANNNPYKYTDPTGRDATIVENKDGSKTITIPIHFTGEANTEENRNDFEQAIEDIWSGETEFGEFIIDVVQVTSGTENIIELINGTGQANTEKIYVDSKDALTAAAHEAGHLMGHRDEYNTRTTLPDAGREGNVMASYLGTGVDAENFTHILGAFGGKSSVKTYTHDR